MNNYKKTYPKCFRSVGYDKSIRGKMLRLRYIGEKFSTFKTVEEAKQYLSKYVNDLIYIYEKYYLIDSGYATSGEDLYGYDSEESILADLRYIADRWMCAERIRWMIDLVIKYQPSEDLLKKANYKLETKEKYNKWFEKKNLSYLNKM